MITPKITTYERTENGIKVVLTITDNYCGEVSISAKVSGVVSSDANITTAYLFVDGIERDFRGSNDNSSFVLSTIVTVTNYQSFPITVDIINYNQQFTYPWYYTLESPIPPFIKNAKIELNNIDYMNMTGEIKISGSVSKSFEQTGNLDIAECSYTVGFIDFNVCGYSAISPTFDNIDSEGNFSYSFKLSDIIDNNSSFNILYGDSIYVRLTPYCYAFEDVIGGDIYRTNTLIISKPPNQGDKIFVVDDLGNINKYIPFIKDSSGEYKSATLTTLLNLL